MPPLRMRRHRPESSSPAALVSQAARTALALLVLGAAGCAVKDSSLPRTPLSLGERILPGSPRPDDPQVICRAASSGPDDDTSPVSPENGPAPRPAEFEMLPRARLAGFIVDQAGPNPLEKTPQPEAP